MRQPLTTFIGGVITGAVMVVASGYIAGFERPLRQAVPSVAVAQPVPQTGWEDFIAAESRIPKHLQACVTSRYAAERERLTRTWQQGLTFAMERAVGQCVALQKPPKTFAQK